MGLQEHFPPFRLYFTSDDFWRGEGPVAGWPRERVSSFVGLSVQVKATIGSLFREDASDWAERRSLETFPLSQE